MHQVICLVVMNSRTDRQLTLGIGSNPGKKVADISRTSSNGKMILFI
jgi:hypothetical protein